MRSSLCLAMWLTAARLRCQIPTSIATQKQAESLNIPLATMNEYSELDVAIDGADSVDPQMVRVIQRGRASSLWVSRII